eukprot:CAMPEP_0206034884 /NCGR_PEP_ID=MMETSP1466-20131121/1683_1 /ASSEMBLY_ACC=CAM_ASM_001126 /TAXON_ID=44452 /ORGANISM="Pavlova gyrans, Strain CCMP608" /LENGTH=240 /DNA_ID=CAMNT_0053409211 /DNA_START=271 /DNA_END=993 /DNA_ORIENTATION=+
MMNHALQPVRAAHSVEAASFGGGCCEGYVQVGALLLPRLKPLSILGSTLLSTAKLTQNAQSLTELTLENRGLELRIGPRVRTLEPQSSENFVKTLNERPFLGEAEMLLRRVHHVDCLAVCDAKLRTDSRNLVLDGDQLHSRAAASKLGGGTDSSAAGAEDGAGVFGSGASAAAGLASARRAACRAASSFEARAFPKYFPRLNTRQQRDPIPDRLPAIALFLLSLSRSSSSDSLADSPADS